MQKLPVSVCILCKNEEDRLHRCLSALKDFEEIIIADTGSSDSSLEIISQYEVKLYKDDWVNFSHNRKILFERASCKWIFWLDADEVVSPSLVEEIKNKILNNDADVSAFEMNRMVYFEDQWIKHGGWFPDWVLRVFRSDAWHMEMNAVHESLHINGKKVRLNNILEHYSFRSWEDLHQRSKFYESLWVKDRMSRGKKVSKLSPYTHASFVFFKNLVLRRGFLDGKLGLQIVLLNTKEVFRKYCSLLKAIEESKK